MLPYPITLALFLVCWLDSASAIRYRNVTVDDQDSRILYFPPTSWAMISNQNMDANGTHMLTGDPKATATITFNFSYVYFMSDLWPYKVTADVSVDDGNPFTLDMQDHSAHDLGSGDPSQPSRALAWSAGTGLDEEHTIRISVHPGDPYAIVDMFIFAIEDTNPSSSSMSLASVITQTVASVMGPTATAFSSAPGPSNKTHTVPIFAIAIITGGLILLALLIFTSIFVRHKKQRAKKREYYARYAAVPYDLLPPTESVEFKSPPTYSGAYDPFRSKVSSPPLAPTKVKFKSSDIQL